MTIKIIYILPANHRDALGTEMSPRQWMALGSSRKYDTIIWRTGKYVTLFIYGRKRDNYLSF